MKILMTTDTVGGVWTYCIELCRGLQIYDVEVHLVTMGAKMSDWQKHEASSLSNVVVYETDFLLEWMHKPWADIRECGEWLLHLEKQVNPDLVHLNCFAYGSLSFTAPVIVVAHSDVYSWFLSVKKNDPSAEWNDYFWCVKKGLLNADVVVAPSQAMMDAIQNIYSVCGFTKVIYNGRDHQLFYSKEKQSVVFSMGRLWDEAKNIRLVVNAAHLIAADLRIAGDNSFDQSHFVLSDNVQFLGKLSSAQIAEELSTASVFVLPAKYEPFGLSPLEAALSGCALVLGDIPSLKEIWQDTALYVDTDDAEALGQVVTELLCDSEKLEYYRAGASMRAKLFSSQAMCVEYWDLYHRLAAEKSKHTKKELV